MHALGFFLRFGLSGAGTGTERGKGGGSMVAEVVVERERSAGVLALEEMIFSFFFLSSSTNKLPTRYISTSGTRPCVVWRL